MAPLLYPRFRSACDQRAFGLNAASVAVSLKVLGAAENQTAGPFRVRLFEFVYCFGLAPKFCGVSSETAQ